MNIWQQLTDKSWATQGVIGEINDRYFMTQEELDALEAEEAAEREANQNDGN